MTITSTTEDLKKQVKRGTKGKVSRSFFVVKLLATGVGLIGLLLIAKSLFDWFDYNDVEIRSPVVVATQSPITVTPRKQNIIKTVHQISYGEDVLEVEEGSVEDIIIQEFGREAPKALAIFQAESGLKQDAWNCNLKTLPNGELCTSSACGASLDVGALQINYESHKDKPECSWESLATLEGNIACGKAVFVAAGNNFSPWVAAHKLGLVN